MLLRCIAVSAEMQQEDEETGELSEKEQFEKDMKALTVAQLREKLQESNAAMSKYGHRTTHINI
jgi:hypothetical protein